MAALTHNALTGLKAGKWASDMGARGAGTLVAYRSGSGRDGRVLFYFRYTKPDGERDTYPLGEWDGTGGPLSLKVARGRATELSARYTAGARDLRAVLEAEEREEQRQRQADARAAESELERQQATLGALMDAYVGWMEAKGKASVSSVQAAIKRHIKEPWPRLWETPADDLTTDDLLDVLIRLTDEEKLREAAKLRSYLQAAYNAGMKARTAASATPALRSLRIRTNPARDLSTIEGASNARHRALNVTELRAYWSRIAALPDHDGACLRFHLLTGGQRIDQLARATAKDYDADQSTVTLWDAKGRRTTPRMHIVPLLPEAVTAMHAMAPERVGEFLFTTTAGRIGIVPSTAYLRCRAVMETMLEAGELPGGEFSITDIRRTVETRLADLGIHSDVRAQLQSHGLGGVQARHYDRHDYLKEKRDALEALFRLITETSSTVVSFRRKAIAD